MGSGRWRVPFFTMWTGQAFSLVGSALVQFGLIWWLTETTGSATTVAMATSASLIPTVVLGPISGVFVDRWHRKWVLIISDGSIALSTALLGVLFWLGVAEIWHVYAILFLRSLGDTFQTPAVTATTALMVPEDELTRVGGLNRTLQGVIRFVAPPMGALLLATMDVQGNVKETEIIWITRLEQQQWRVAGMATMPFAGGSPLVLNFEDPEQMQHAIDETKSAEIARRAAQDDSRQAELPETPSGGTIPR